MSLREKKTVVSYGECKETWDSHVDMEIDDSDRDADYDPHKDNDSSDLSEREQTPPTKERKYITWSKAEVSTVKTIFAKHIARRTFPGTEEIKKLQRQQVELANRSVAQIKSKVQHIINKKRK